MLNSETKFLNKKKKITKKVILYEEIICVHTFLV